MSLLSRLQQDMVAAMKAQDKARLSTVRMLISAIKYAEVDKPEMTESEVEAVLIKEAKKRREAIEAYRQGGREESAKSEEEELKVIQAYLPQTMSEEEIREKVANILKTVDSGTNFGQVMQVVMKELKGKADGGMIAKIVKEISQ